MPIQYVRQLTGRVRTPDANRHLGFALAFVAGAINAGGFLAVAQYTSHMTGIVSAIADDLVLREYGLVLAGLGGLLSFLTGAACSAIMINYSRGRKLHGEYALPLLLEACLLLCFGLLGARLSEIQGLFVPLTVMLLCFIMGLQNAIITKLSHGEVRTTHLTGVITDIGIELGKLIYWNRGRAADQQVSADRDRLRVLLSLTVCFLGGGVAGALGFKHVGYVSTLPLAALLVALALIPALDDLTPLFRKAPRR